MNPAHLHLMITHVPVLGSVFGFFLLVLALLKGDQDLKRMSLWIFVLAGLAAVPTYLSGRPANALLMQALPGTSMDPVDQHAEIAIVALVAASVLGLFAWVGLAVYRRGTRSPGWYSGIAFLLALLTAATMTWTASLGGTIRHTEIQPASAAMSRSPH
jgi:hypothetical protein